MSDPMDREDCTIKEAADATGISATTIRRYIKAGKIGATLSRGRYGPEYRISRESLRGAGLEQNNALPVKRNRNNNGHSADDLSLLLKDFVPSGLYQELTMKHEQLLVQYGMVRAGGKRLMELKAENEMKEQMFQDQLERMKATVKKCRDEIEFLKKHLRLAELEMEEKNNRIRELKDKVNLLELVSRNAVTTETIEKQFMEICSKQKEIRQMSRDSDLPAGNFSEGNPGEKREEDH